MDINENIVLIIDDDVWMQRILSKTLENFGFTTILTSNGIDGIAQAVEHNPILIILDILMPELSGHLTLRILKQIKATRNIPVFVVSAMADTENLGMAVKSGSAGFISKPFTRATIYEKLVQFFGKDQLLAISQNKPLEVAKEISFENKVTGDVSQSLNELASSLNLKSELPVDAKQNKGQEQLLQHYQEDEKRSIESIKKLLLKTKK